MTPLEIKRIRKAATWLTRVHNCPDLADDVSQQACLRLMEKGKKCESRAYADACAKMALRELGRQKMGGSKTEPRNKDGGRDHGTIEHVSIDLAELPPLQPSQDRDLMIAGILSRYEEHEQLLLTMRYIWEFEVDEIASFLNVSIPTVYARLRNILVAPDRIYVKRYT